MPVRSNLKAQLWADDVLVAESTDPGLVDVTLRKILNQEGVEDGDSGITGPKSGLWAEFERVVAELKPSWTVIENNGHRWRAWVPHVRRALHSLGYASLPLRLRASDLGAWHQRARVFIAANSDGSLLRLQQGGRLRACWQAALQFVRSRAPWLPADADDQGQLQPSWCIREERRRPSNSGGRRIEPSLAGSVHGLPDRMERESALGDAVVPACAEAVGEFVKACCDYAGESP